MNADKTDPLRPSGLQPLAAALEAVNLGIRWNLRENFSFFFEPSSHNCQAEISNNEHQVPY